MKRRIALFLMSLVLVLSAMTTGIGKIDAYAGVNYNAEKALAYARAHWNDGQGWCAEFVSRCVIAGGIDIPVIAGVFDLSNGLKSKGLTPQYLNLDSDGYARYSKNSDRLAAGDVVVQECHTHYNYPRDHYQMPHVILCGGYDSAGVATFYAHNGAQNNERYVLSLNTGYEHNSSCDMRAIVYHLSSGSSTPISYNVTVTNSGVDDITETNAIVRASCSKASYVSVSKCGLLFGTSSSNLSEIISENVPASTNNHNGGTGFSIWYNLTDEARKTLTKGTTYYYRFYCEVNGQKYYSDIASFKTAGTNSVGNVKYFDKQKYITFALGSSVKCYSSADAADASGNLYGHGYTSNGSFISTKYAILPNSTYRYYAKLKDGANVWIEPDILTVVTDVATYLHTDVSTMTTTPDTKVYVRVTTDGSLQEGLKVYKNNTECTYDQEGLWGDYLVSGEEKKYEFTFFETGTYKVTFTPPYSDSVAPKIVTINVVDDTVPDITTPVIYDTTATDFKIRWTVSDDLGMNPSDVSVTIMEDTENHKVVAQTGNISPYNNTSPYGYAIKITPTFTPCTGGNYIMLVTAKDLYGNVNTYEFWFTVFANSNHSYSTKYTIDKQATLSQDGSKSYHCTNKGCTSKKGTVTIPRLKTIALSANSYTYNGSVKNPTLTVKDSKGNTISSSNYTLTKPSGRKEVGEYKYTIKFKGEYSGTKTLSFKINPKATSIISATGTSKAFTVKWKKITTQVTGYQIRYSRKASMDSPTDVRVTKNTTTSKKITSLKSKTKYYVQIRTYKKVGSKYYYSKWSDTVKVKTK